MAKKRRERNLRAALATGKMSPNSSLVSAAEGLMEALDRLRASRMTPEQAEKFIEREKQKREDEKKVSKSIKRQETKIEKESERKQKKLRELREDPDKRRRSSGGGGGGFGALRGMESNLPGRRKMAKGGEVVAKKSKKKGRRGMGAATRGGGAVA